MVVRIIHIPTRMSRIPKTSLRMRMLVDCFLVFFNARIARDFGKSFYGVESLAWYARLTRKNAHH